MKRKELWRKVVHVVCGSAALIVIATDYAGWFFFFLLCAGIALVFVCRKYKPWLLYKPVLLLEREEYVKTFPGRSALFFVTACLLAVKLFPKNIATASIAVMTFVDPVLAMTPTKRGKLKKRYFLVYMFGFFIAVVLLGIFFDIVHAVIAAAVAVLSESVRVSLAGKDLDDNVIIVLATGTALLLSTRYLAS